MMTTLFQHHPGLAMMVLGCLDALTLPTRNEAVGAYQLGGELVQMIFSTVGNLLVNCPGAAALVSALRNPQHRLQVAVELLCLFLLAIGKPGESPSGRGIDANLFGGRRASLSGSATLQMLMNQRLAGIAGEAIRS